MAIVKWNPEQLQAKHARAEALVPRIPTILREEKESPSFLDAFTAAWSRENLTYALAREANVSFDEEGEAFKEDPSFNPYTYMRENWDDIKREEFEFDIRRGLFESSRSPGAVEAKARRLTREKELIRQMEEGPLVGMLLGAFGGAATDLSTYTPIGPLAKARSLGRVAKGLIAGATSAAVPEIGLQQLQDYRTAQESFMNIGTSAILGGGIGAFSRFLNPDHPMHYRNALNPLREDNFGTQGVGVRTPEGDIEVIGSAGAARYLEKAPKALEGLSQKVPGVRWMADKVTGATPVGRALKYSGARTRNILVSMMDMGGMLTDTGRFGQRLGPSAEDIKRDLMVKSNRLFLIGESLVRKLNIELGASKAQTALGFRGMVNDQTFTDIARKKLLQTFDINDSRALASQYGEEAAQKIEAKANEYAEAIHKVNEEFESELIEIGKLRDEQKVEDLTNRLVEAREKVKEAEVQSKAAEAEGDAKASEALDNARAERDEIAAQLAKEARKPKAMGRDYGHAQLWDHHSIQADPDGFEEFLYDVLGNRPEEDWMLEAYNLTLDQFDRLGVEDVAGRTVEEGEALRKQIVRDWAGEEAVYRNDQAQRRLKAAEEAYRQSRIDLLDTARALGFVSRETKRLKLSEARKFRDQFNTRLEAERSRRAQIKAEQRAFRAGAAAARTRTVARQGQFVPEKPDVKPGKKTPTVPQMGDTLSVARARARADQLARELQRVDSRVKRMEKRLARMDEAHSQASIRLEEVNKAKKAIAESKKDAESAKRAAAKEVKKASRAAKRASKRTPLDEAVSDIRYNLMNRDSLPHAILDRIIPETGRVKARRIILTKDQRRFAEQAGFLRTDLPQVLHSQYDQLSGYIGLHEGLGIGEGKTFDSWSGSHGVIRAVDDEYTELIAAAKSQKEKSRLIREREKVKKDLNGLKDRLLGTENVGLDRDGWVFWLSQKTRQANFVRWGAGFLLPSIADVGNVSLRSGSLGKLLFKHGKHTATLMRQLYDENPSEFLAMVNATEIGMQGIRMAQLMDAEDAMKGLGIGARGSLKHRITSNVDRGGQWLSEKTNVVSGMRMWNRFWKITNGVFRSYQLRDATARYDELSEIEVAELASLGIDRAAARRIQKMVQDHGRTDANGHWDPNLDAWSTTKEGRTAARDFRVAIERDMNRAIITPGIGDTPLLMSHAGGKVWLQFQTFAFTFLNRFMVPASQRIATWQDAKAIAAVGHTAWAGLLVVMGKDILHGKDPAERFEKGKWADTIFEVGDRSGMYTYLTPYIDSAMKLSQPLQEDAFGEVQIGPSSRFVRNNWAESLAGAGYGLFRDIQAFGATIPEGDKEKMIKKGLLLAPWNTWLRVMHQIGEN